MLLFLLWMLVGYLAGDANGPLGMRSSNDREILAFACFPCATILGLASAYRWPLAGGGIATSSLLTLFTLRPDLLASPFLVTTVRGASYLVHGMLMRGRAPS